MDTVLIITNYRPKQWFLRLNVVSRMTRRSYTIRKFSQFLYLAPILTARTNCQLPYEYRCRATNRPARLWRRPADQGQADGLIGPVQPSSWRGLRVCARVR